VFESSSAVVVITGASAGIGQAIAREVARRGRVGAIVLTARRAERLEALAAEIRTMGPEIAVLTIAADLADRSAPERLVRETVDRFGRIDVLINNAGLGLPTLFADAEPELLERQIAVNFQGPLLLTRRALPYLIESRGMIINIGSSITSVANSALGAYGATKAGLAYWNDALRRELMGTGVRVCLVEPGPIKTEFMTALDTLVPAGGAHAPILENAAPWMSADVNDVAARIVRLIDRPRRRISMLRRVVWPMRALGVLARLCPPLGDWVVFRMQRT
jgi:short-subunit dehydrogenase